MLMTYCDCSTHVTGPCSDETLPGYVSIYLSIYLLSIYVAGGTAAVWTVSKHEDYLAA